MSSELYAVWHKVQHTDNAAVVEPCKAVQLVNDIHTLQLIIGGSHQVCYTVDDDQLDSLVLVEIHVESRADDVQPLLS
jgi:hypothetical protein